MEFTNAMLCIVNGQREDADAVFAGERGRSMQHAAILMWWPRRERNGLGGVDGGWAAAMAAGCMPRGSVARCAVAAMCSGSSLGMLKHDRARSISNIPYDFWR